MSTVTAPEAGARPVATPRVGSWVRRYRFECLIGAFALLPILVAVVRALVHGYTPIGDDGLLLLRSRDVLTANHPWLGTWSSSSLSLGVNLNNPGPLLFDLMALPVKALGSGPGLAIGVGLLNAACLMGAAVMAHRVAGRRAFVLVLLIGSTIAWSMGSELIYDVWQPHVLVMPFLLLTVLAWAMAEGRVLALPWAMALVSLLVQSHLSYVYLAPLAVVAGIVGHLVATRGEWRTLLRPAAWSIGVVAIAWAQPVWQQLHGPGPSNLGLLADAASGRYGTTDAIGAGLATRLVGAVVALPPWFLRPSFASTIPAAHVVDDAGRRLPIPGLPGTAAAALGLLVVVVLLVVTALASRGVSRRAERSALIIATVLLLGGLAALAAMPVGAIGLAAHQMRWLWPIGGFVAFALLLRWTDRLPSAPAVAVLAGLTVLVAAANLPTSVVPAGQTADRAATPNVRRMVAAVPALRGRGVLLFDPGSLRFAEPFSGPLLAALAAADIPFVTADDGFVHQVGEGRRYGCSAPPSTARDCGVRQIFSVVTGDAAYRVPSGSTRAIFVPGLDARAAREFARLGDRLRAAGVRFDGYGVPTDVDPAHREDAARYRELQIARDRNSVAVLLRPAP